MGDGLVNVAGLHGTVFQQGLDDGGAGVVVAGVADLLFGHPELVEENFKDLVVGVHDGEREDCLRLRRRGVKERHCAVSRCHSRRVA